jgi:hypothetical protein
MSTWSTTLRVTDTVKLLITDEEGNDLLRARLPRRCYHPRALLTLLEGLALWGGTPLTAVISVDDSAGRSDADLFGGQLWPAESALVRFDFHRSCQQLRLRGLGDFRDVLVIHPRGGRS